MSNVVEIRVVASGAAEAAKFLLAVGDAGAAVGRVVVKGSDDASRGLLHLGDTGRRVFEIFSGVSLGNIFVDALAKLKEFTFETIRLGAEARVQEEAFRLVAESVGASSTALAEGLKRASAGIANQSDVMLASARALQQGLQPEQITSLMEIARSQSKLTGATVTQAFNDITIAVTNQQTRQLKAYGIIIDTTRAFERYALKIGTTAAALTEAGQSQAIFLATQEALKGKTLDTTSAIIKQAEAWERWQSNLKDTREEIGKFLIEMGAAGAKIIEQTGFLAELGKAAGFVATGLKALSSVWLGTEMPRKGVITDKELAALRAMPDLLDDIDNKASKVPEQFDRIKDAMAKVEQSTALVNARFASSRATFADVEAVTASAIARLQALGATANPEVVMKIEALRGALLKAQQQVQALDASIVALGTHQQPLVEGAQLFIDVTEAETKARVDFLSALADSKLADEMALEAEVLGVVADEAAKVTFRFSDFTSAMGDATQEAALLGRSLGDTLAAQITVTEKALLATAAAFDKDHEEVKKLQASLADLKSQAFDQALRDIGIEAKLLGPDFDAVAASLEVVKTRMLEAARASDDVLDPAVQALKAQFDQLVDFQKTRALFQDLFSSVGSAINTLVQGVLLGTQTMAQAFKKLGQSIVIDFVNRIIQQALNPLVQAAASVVASLLVGTPAQIAAAAVPGAVGAGTGTGGAGAGGGFAQNFASIARLGGGVVNIFPGITAFPSNFAAGGISGGLFGLESSTISLGTGEALTVAGTEGLIGASGAVSASFTALSASFAAVGAAIGVFMIAMDETKTNLGKAIQSATLIGATVIGGVLGGPVGAGVGALVGFAINWIEDMFGLFGKELTHAQREKIELARTTQNVAPLATGLSNVLDAQKLVDLLTQFTSGSIGGTSVAAVMALLHTPGGLLTVGQGGGTPQFPGETLNDPARLMKLLTEHPEYLQISVQAGVAQGLLAPLNDAFRDLVLEAVKRIEAIQKAREALTTDIPAQMKKLLPEAIFQDFTTNTLAPLLAQLDSLVASGRSLAELKPEFDALQAQIETLGQVVAVYTQLSNQIASLSGDLTTLTTNAITNAEAGLDLADKAVMEAHVNLLLAIGGPEIIAAAQDLQTAVLARYNMEKQLVAGIETAIGGLLQAVGKPLMDLQIGLATGPLARTGDTGPLASLLDGLQILAETSKSTALQLFAVASGIQAILAGVPAAITGGALTRPESILPSVLAQASPFLTQLTAFTEQARHAGDFQAALALLQQHVGIIQALGQAAIAGVQQWQQAAVAASQAAIAAIDKQEQAQIAAIQAAGQAEVTAIQEATAARREALDAEKTALQEQLALARQWGQVAKSLGDYLTQLSLGSQAPSNPMVQMDLARSLFADAYAAFLANQTSGGVTDVQQSAADLLAAAQLIYARTSPEYAALFAYITSTLGQVQATAEDLATPEEEMVARLADIDAELKDLQTASQAQIQAVQDSTAAQVAAIQDAATAARALIMPVEEINQTAKDLILEIQTTLEPILADLATQQDALLSQLLDAQEAILVVITAGKTVTEFMALKAAETVAALDDIRTMLGTFLQGTPPATPALDENAARLAAAGADLSRAGADLSDAADMLIDAAASDLDNDIQDDQAIQAQLDANQQTLDAINALTNAIDGLTDGIQGLSDGLSGLGDTGDGEGDGFQHGTPFVPRTGSYLLHRGEMVLPPAIADIARTAQGRGSGLGSAVHVTITVNAAPGMDAREIAEHVGKVMRRELRLGPSNQIQRESR